MSEEEFDFEVALSFAGEDRDYVKKIRDSLRKLGIPIFYDEDHLAEMWGQDLGEYFDDVYRKRARYAVIFVSRHYVAKAWPSHERKSALARAIESKLPYVLPVRLDDSEVPGLRPTTSYIDARRVGIPAIVDVIQQKLGAKPDVSTTWNGLTPRTKEELEQIGALRPTGWEYLLYAGSLYVELQQREAKHRDYTLGYAASMNRSLDPDRAIQYLRGALAEISRIVGQVDSVLSEDVQERAFGKPGEPGDAELIRHWARRLISIYEDLLDWVGVVRGTAVPDEFKVAFGLAARFAENPIREFREFVERIVGAMDGLTAHLERPKPREPLVMELQLVLTIDEDVLKAFTQEMNRLESTF